MNNTKDWYQSITIWVNIALILIDAINSMAKIIPIPSGIISGIGTLGIILRSITKSGITLGKKN